MKRGSFCVLERNSCWESHGSRWRGCRWVETEWLQGCAFFQPSPHQWIWLPQLLPSLTGNSMFLLGHFGDHTCPPSVRDRRWSNGWVTDVSAGCSPFLLSDPNNSSPPWPFYRKHTAKGALLPGTLCLCTHDSSHLNALTALTALSPSGKLLFAPSKLKQHWGAPDPHSQSFLHTWVSTTCLTTCFIFCFVSSHLLLFYFLASRYFTNFKCSVSHNEYLSIILPSGRRGHFSPGESGMYNLIPSQC